MYLVITIIFNKAFNKLQNEIKTLATKGNWMELLNINPVQVKKTA